MNLSRLSQPKQNILLSAVCLLCTVAIFAAVNLPTMVSVSASTRQLPIYCVQRDQKMISLSFDAAWGDVKVR